MNRALPLSWCPSSASCTVTVDAPRAGPTEANLRSQKRGKASPSDHPGYTLLKQAPKGSQKAGTLVRIKCQNAPCVFWSLFS